MLALAVLTVFSISSNAQPPEGFQFGAGIRLGLPVGDLADFHSFGVGGELQGEFGFSEKFSAVINTGYSSFFGKDGADAVGIIPIIAGVRVYPSANFFIGAKAGYGVLTGNGNSEGAFCYQPQVGYNCSNFQVALNYNALTKNSSTVGHIGLTGIFKLGGKSGSAQK